MLLFICGEFLKIADNADPVTDDNNSSTPDFFKSLFEKRPEYFKEISKKGLFFRGESKIHEYTIPSLYRDNKFILNEDEMLKSVSSLFPDEVSGQKYLFDRLTIMQHHGLPTRVLDLTSNALVALYFACENVDNDGYVLPFSPIAKDVKSQNNCITKIKYSNSDTISILSALSLLSYEDKVKLFSGYNGREIIIPDNSSETINLYHIIRQEQSDFSARIESKDIFGAHFVKPSHVDERVIRQNGAFIIIGNDINDRESYLENKANIAGLIDLCRISYSKMNKPVRIRIPKEAKRYILGELNLLGINAFSIYPEMDQKIKYIKDLFI